MDIGILLLEFCYCRSAENVEFLLGRPESPIEGDLLLGLPDATCLFATSSGEQIAGDQHYDTENNHNLFHSMAPFAFYYDSDTNILKVKVYS